MTALAIAIATLTWVALSVAVSPLIGKLICPKIHEQRAVRDE